MDDPHPETKPAGDSPPPRPPNCTTIGIGPGGGDFNKNRRETITKAADGEGKFIRQSAGRGQHGHVIIRVEPNGRGKGNTIHYHVVDGSIPEEYMKPTLEGIQEALNNGVYAGYPVVDIVVHVISGTSHKTDSNELAFKMAAIFAIKDAVKKAGPLVIE